MQMRIRSQYRLLYWKVGRCRGMLPVYEGTLRDCIDVVMTILGAPPAVKRGLQLGEGPSLQHMSLPCGII